jgi:hypothetical protein
MPHWARMRPARTGPIFSGVAPARRAPAPSAHRRAARRGSATARSCSRRAPASASRSRRLHLVCPLQRTEALLARSARNARSRVGRCHASDSGARADWWSSPLRPRINRTAFSRRRRSPRRRRKSPDRADRPMIASAAGPRPKYGSCRKAPGHETKPTFRTDGGPTCRMGWFADETEVPAPTRSTGRCGSRWRGIAFWAGGPTFKAGAAVPPPPRPSRRCDSGDEQRHEVIDVAHTHARNIRAQLQKHLRCARDRVCAPHTGRQTVVAILALMLISPLARPAPAQRHTTESERVNGYGSSARLAQREPVRSDADHRGRDRQGRARNPLPAPARTARDRALLRHRCSDTALAGSLRPHSHSQAGGASKSLAPAASNCASRRTTPPHNASPVKAGVAYQGIIQTARPRHRRTLR